MPDLARALGPDPLLDIVMLVHDQPGWSDLAIRAVEHHTRNPYRLILVDMASTAPATLAVLEAARRRGHTVVVLSENRSFSNGVNAGVSVGHARNVVLLNSDAIVTEGWDGWLVQDLADRMVGLTGARSNYASGAQGDPTFTGAPPWLVFVCVAFRRQVWEAVGPMDEQTFDGFSSEDLDYSWRVVKAGYQLKVSTAFVLHAGSRTLGATIGDAAARALNDRKYNLRLVEKWGQEWVTTHSKLKQSVMVVGFHPNHLTFVEFAYAFVGLKYAPDYAFHYQPVKRAPIHIAREAAANAALDGGYDVLVMLDDDACFPPDTLRRLLGHQKDVVCALAYQRKPPHMPCVYAVGEDGLMGQQLDDLEHTGLRQVGVSGLHVSAHRTSVFKRLRDAQIRQYFGGFDNKLGEDFAYCTNLRRIGVPVHVDTELIADHLGDSIVVNEEYRRAFRQARQAAPPPARAVVIP